MRLHLNWVDTRRLFALEHGFHADAWKRKLLEEESNTARVVAVVTFKYPQEAWDGLVTEVIRLRDVTPQMAGCEAFNFVAAAGKAVYPWALFISSGAHIVIAKAKRREYRKLLVECGILQALH